MSIKHVKFPYLSTRVACLTAAATLAAAPAAFADWHEPVGGASPLNSSATHNAGTSKEQGRGVDLATIGGKPYVAWNEDTTQPNQGSSSTIHVARLADTGLAWLKVGESLTPSHPISLRSSTSSDAPSLTSVNGTPWIAWQEGVTQTDSEIRVAKLNDAATGWDEVPTPAADHPINHVRTDPGGLGMFPTLRDSGGRPYVSFFEADPGTGSLFFGNTSNPAQVWVDRLNATGDGWDEVGGGPVNPDSTHDAAFPRMTVVNGVPWVVYFQIAVVNNNPAIDLNVAHLSDDGQSWVQMPSLATLSPQGQMAPPDITTVGGKPYVVIGSPDNSSTVRLAVYTPNAAGDNWDLVGGGPVNSGTDGASSATITDLDGSPWVSWQTRSGPAQVYASRLVGGVWQQAGTSVNPDTSHSVQSTPVITSVNGFPWVAYGQDDGTAPGNPSCCTQVRVSRLEPDFQADFAYPSDTGASLLARLETYGLSYPAGFQYGPGQTLTQSTATQTVNGSPDYAFQTISGLTPASLYSFRPFATAGTPQPLVTGSTDAFATSPAASSNNITASTGTTGGSSNTSGTGSPAAASQRLFAMLVSDLAHLRRGHTLRLRYLVSDKAHVVVTITRHGRAVAKRDLGEVTAGGHSFSWRSGHRPRGVYRINLVAASDTGSASDGAGFRIVR